MNKAYAKERIRHFKKFIDYWTKQRDSCEVLTIDQAKWYSHCQHRIYEGKDKLKYYEEKLNE